MSSRNLQEMSVNELVRYFITIALTQNEARFRISEFNRLFDEMEKVEQELKRRQGDRRHALLALYTHPNVEVRLAAAKATLAVAPEAARRMLQSIAESHEYPQAGDAGMSLDALDSGIFKPR